jgi:class 3 adenylate cyclase/tetratricopeptide (TPR) repeat protein
MTVNEQADISRAIASIEAQRAALGDAVANAALRGLRERLDQLTDVALARARAPGERKLVTVMFADVTAFTAMSEALDPERVRALLNGCFDALVPCIERYGGVVDKFIGDAVMALFGAPITREDDAERALRASLEMIDALAAFNARNGTKLGMHFGLNTGAVVAGGLGSDGRQQYSVMGDTVNTASRLADAADDGQIVVGPDTFRLTSTLFDFLPIPDIRLKGRSGVVTGYRLLGRKLGVRAARGTPELRSPIVGRADEMMRLDAVLHAAIDGHGDVIAICGEPGLGKSRLVSECADLARRQCARRGIRLRWTEGRSQSYAAGSAYGAAQRLLDELLGVRPDAPVADVEAALRSTLLDNLEPAQCDDAYAYLACLRGLPLPDADPRIDQVLAEALQQRMRSAFAELVLALARRNLVVLVWEDLHWADPSSLGLLASVVPLCRDARILMLLTFRTNESTMDAWYAQHVGRRRALEPIMLVALDREQSERLVQNLLAVADLPEATRALIVDRADGNPFFVEELARSLVDAGAVILQGDRASAGEGPSRVEIPATLQGVIAARIDRLPLDDKLALQSASILGRVFQQNVLALLLERERAGGRLADCLSDLELRELVRRGAIEWEYWFKHAITHDVTYNTMLQASRRRLHAMAGEAIESLFGDRVDELAPTLALHFTRAEMPARAVAYLKSAAARARHTYSNAEAIKFYRAALDQAAMLPAEIAGLHENLGQVLALIGKGSEARDCYRQARQCLPEDDALGRARLHRLDAVSFMGERQPERALEACAEAESALDAASRRDTPAWREEWLDVGLERNFAHYWLNQLPELLALDERMRPTMMAYGSAKQRSRYYRALFMIDVRRTQMRMSPSTFAYAESALAAAREANDAGEIMRARLCLGITHELRRAWAESERELREGLEIGERIGDREGVVTTLVHLTNVHRGMRSVENVRAFAARTREAAADARMAPYVSNACAHLAWVAWRQGDASEAMRLGLEAMAHMGAAPIPRWYGLWPLIAVATSGSDVDSAIAHCRALLVPFESPRPAELDAALRDAIGAFDAGDREKALSWLQQTVRLAEDAAFL